MVVHREKAGTIILLACILVWFISTYGVVDGTFMAVEDQNDSILAALGTLICWIFNPLGWGDWQAASAAVTGLIAKENVVGTLGILYNGDAGWYANVQAAFTPLVAYSFLCVQSALCSLLRSNGCHQARDEQSQVVLGGDRLSVWTCLGRGAVDLP